jgi:Na+/proline symporter
MISNHPYSDVFDWNWLSKTNFFKQFFAGIAMTIVLNGLDQNMMQKNLTCKNIKEAQKNLFYFSGAFVLANLLFLSLGVLLYHYASTMGIAIPTRSDDLYPLLAIKHFGVLAGVFFLLGIIAAAYSSADSALTALTTAFCIDFLNLDATTAKSKQTRIKVHVAFSFIMFMVIILFKLINEESVVTSVFKAAGYTYGPLLGLFTFGIITKRSVRDRFVPYIAVASPIACYVLNIFSEELLWGYKFGFELLLLNGFLVFMGLFMISRKTEEVNLNA